MLLAVLAAKAHTSLPRDIAIDILWPDADADAAVNNLNQTVFQLRRYIDPTYRGGESPEYIISTSEQVTLNPALVHTDLDEIRRLSDRVGGADWNHRQSTALKAIDLIRGQFLADLQYEEWAAVQQLTVQNDLRDRLMPIATGAVTEYELRVATRAASALVSLDPYDEPAVLALVECLARSGRRRAARDLVIGFMHKVTSELDEQPSIELERVARGFQGAESTRN
jgi:DNA-binding SARP family transcriptional activator